MRVRATATKIVITATAAIGLGAAALIVAQGGAPPPMMTRTTTGNTSGYAPDTCREGFVWREARPGDHVCVTPETRAQTSVQNRYGWIWRGVGGCKTGYVHRAIWPGDIVCVQPAVRAHAARDNREAPFRVAWVWTSLYRYPSSCGENCATSGDDAAFIQLNGTHHAMGANVRLTVRYVRDNRRIWTGVVPARPRRGYTGGTIVARTDLLYCPRPPKRWDNAYVMAEQVGTGLVSPRVPLYYDRDCTIL